MANRSSSVGKSTKILRGILRRIASSRSKGRLVAPRISTPEFNALMPSHSAINWFIISRCETCRSDPLRELKMVSTSSIKTTQGLSLRAREKIACTRLDQSRKMETGTFTFFSPSPTYISYTSLPFISRTRAPLSFATALASIVLPVPGGPNNKTPLIKFFDKTPYENASGLLRGKDTKIFNV